jgi:hypothetical protein
MEKAKTQAFSNSEERVANSIENDNFNHLVSQNTKKFKALSMAFLKLMIIVMIGLMMIIKTMMMMVMIIKLKEDDLFEELEEELLEYLEFEKLCLDSGKSRMDLLSNTENHIILSHNNCKIAKTLIPILCSNNRKDLILVGGNRRENLFLKNVQKEKHLLLYDLCRINCLFKYKKIDLEIKILKITIN